jgi:hypothetical protein
VIVVVPPAPHQGLYMRRVACATLLAKLGVHGFRTHPGTQHEPTPASSQARPSQLQDPPRYSARTNSRCMRRRPSSWMKILFMVGFARTGRNPPISHRHPAGRQRASPPRGEDAGAPQRRSQRSLRNAAGSKRAQLQANEPERRRQAKRTLSCGTVAWKWGADPVHGVGARGRRSERTQGP